MKKGRCPRIRVARISQKPEKRHSLEVRWGLRHRCWEENLVAPAGIEALNLAFDVTPAELIAGIITEAGVRLPKGRRSGSRTARAERSVAARQPLDGRAVPAARRRGHLDLVGLLASFLGRYRGRRGEESAAGYGTALGVLQSAWRQGRLASVWVDETRPLLQGARLTAWELTRLGIPFHLITDSSAGAVMAQRKVDRIVVGADRIAANGDTANKIGTYTVAVLAHHHGIPFYVAAPLSTIDRATATGKDIPIEERQPEEVTSLGGNRVAPEGTEALNLAFDVTPAELIAGIITEVGVLEPPYTESIAKAFEEAPDRSATEGP
jgi:methylthioribose-1-phosphate isomerase